MPTNSILIVQKTKLVVPGCVLNFELVFLAFVLELFCEFLFNGPG